jgi:hypothetical protein
LKPSLALGNKNIPIKKAKTETIVAPIKYGRMNLVNDIPELNMAITSVLLASFEVNQIIERNKKIGKSKLEK